MKKVLFVLMLVLFLVGCGSDEVDIDGKKITYEELQEKIKEANDNLEAMSDIYNRNLDEHFELLGEKEALEGEFQELEEFNKNKDKFENELKELEDEISKKEDEVKTLLNEIDEKQSKLDKLDGEIVKIESEPIKINPGYYYFGIDDIEEGRYKIMAQEGQRGNVFVRSDRGSIVNEIFGSGNDGHSIKEFTFYAENGNELEATIPILLYPVE